MEGNLKGTEGNTRAVSREQNELIGKFKMAAGDKVSNRWQVMEYTYIPKSIDKYRHVNKMKS